MKKTVGVFSLIVMLLSQVFTSFVYAVSGDELPLPEPVVEETISGPEVVEPEIIPEVENPIEEDVSENNETSTGEVVDVVEPVDVEVNTGTTVTTGEETNNLEEEEVLIGTEASSGFIEKITETIKDFLGISGEENFESKEIYGTWEYEGVKVEVYAQTGLFASGTELTIEPVVDEKLEAVQEVLLSGEVDLVEEKVIAFDITFRDPVTQEELQPKDGTVQVKFNYEGNESLVQAEEDEEQEVKVYHLNDIDEEGNKIEELTGTIVEEVEVNEEESVEENVMVVEAENFSVYTIVVQIREEGPLATENQLANFEYGEISIARPNGYEGEGPEGFTIMDRNLGATVTGAGIDTTKKSYGYHYQRGNNYGFDSTVSELSDDYKTGTKINVPEGATGYYGNKFVWGFWNNTWMSTNNNTLWGTSNDIGNQGPCPDGWHVPSHTEWNQLMEYYVGYYNEVYHKSLSLSTTYYRSISDEDFSSGFYNYFLMPFAGLRSYEDATIMNQGSHASLWYSSPSDTDNKRAIGFSLTSSYAGDSHIYRANGLSVRCFKNTYSGTGKIFTITYDFNGGSGSTASINVLSGEKAEKPTDPIKEGVVFSGWYLSGTDIEYDFTDNVVGNIELYAKWRDKVAILLPGKTFNLVIKSIAKDGTTGSVSRIREGDSKITRMQRSGTGKPGIETKISSDDSECPVYAWFSEGILYYFSEAGTIFMNEDSSDMFYYLYSLTNFDLSDFDTSNVTDMSSMFYGCSNLVSVNLSGIDTSKVTNMRGMFSCCYELTSVNLSGIDTSKVTRMDSMFGTTRKLKSINLSGLNLSSVTSMSYMFSDGGLTGINLSGLDLSSVRDMSYMFSSCRYLENINFDGVDTSSLVDIKFMFKDCNKLTNLDLSDFDVINVTSMYGLFQNCSSLTSLNVSNWNTSNVTSMNSMFSNCNKLTSLNISNWNTSSLTDMSYMFQNCSSLTNLDLANFDTSKVTSMFRLFVNDNNLTSLNIGDWNTSRVSDMREVFKNCSSLTSLDIGSRDTSNAWEMTSMFDGCSRLTSLDINNRDTSRVQYFGSMFKGCSGLINLDISNWNTNKMKYANSMFSGCSSLTSLDISNWNVSDAENFSSMFDGCSSLTRIYVGKRFRLSSATSYDNMFNNTINIIGGNGTTYDSSKIDKTYARIDNKYYSGYFTQSGSLAEDIAYLLPGSDFNTKIKSLAIGFEINDHSRVDSLITGFKRYEGDGIPLNVTVDIISSDDSYVPVYAWFDDGVIYYYSDADIIDLNKNSSYMFDMCTSLVNVDFSNLDTSGVTNMNYMFQGCSNLLKMHLNSWNMENVNSLNYMFSGCVKLEDVDLSNWNVAKVSYANYMFNGCTNLTELKLDGWRFSDEYFGFYNLLGGSSIKKVSAKGWVLPKDFSNRVGNFLQNSSVTEEIDVSNRDLSRTEKLYDLFYNTPLKKVVGIKTWTGTNEKLWDMSYMFQSANIEEVDMSDMDFSKVTTVYEMFQGNSSNPSELKKINMSNVKFDSLENMAWFCEKCYNVEEVDLSNWDLNTPNTLTNVSYAFYDAHNLKKVNLHNFGKVSSTYNMFHNNYSLTELDLSGFDTSNTTDMALMFYGVTGLNTLDFTYQDTSNVTNMDRMFYDTTNLQTIYVSEKFNTGMVTTSNEMFGGAISLVGGNGTKYDPNNIDVTYARIDNEYQSGYFTDPNHFAVRYLTVTGEELLKQWISAGQTVEELEDSHRRYSYYTSGDLQTGFDFTEPLYGYTEIYVTWDDVKRVIYEYGTGVEEGIISSGSCLIQRDNNGVAQSESCEVVLPELNVLTGYHTPLWYKQGEDTSYSGTNITLTGDVILEAKATANKYTVVYKPGEGTGEMESQEFEYGKEGILNKNKYSKEGYHFSGWIDLLGKEYRDGETVINLLTEGIYELTAQWLQNAPAAGGGQSVTPAVKEQEHEAAEEKQEDKQEEKQEIKQEEQTEEQSNVPEKNNSSSQSSTQQSSSSSKENTVTVDPEILSAYEWAYENNITTITSLDEANPDGPVTRGHLAKMVVNYATNVLGQEIPEKIPSECRWNDWRGDWESEEIKDYAVKSCALGLMGLDMPKFLPNMQVTRAQFGTIMSRLLWGKKYAGGTPYYRKHLNALKENGIMTQIDNPERRVELRQWVWLMLMRSAENK